MKEDIVVNKGSKYPLNGELMVPEGEGPFKAVVLIQGSGPSDRDETIFGNKPFKDIAEYLCDNGIASIRYDKRTFVYGKQMVKEDVGGITVKEEVIEDAVSATNLLRNDSRIASDQIFLLGHSLGASLAPRIHAEGGNYAGLLMLAGTARGLDEVIIDQTNDSLSQLNAFLRWIGNKQAKKLSKKFEEMKTIDENTARRTKIMGNVYAWYIKEMNEHPVSNYLPSINIPVFVVQGEKDFQVSIEKDFNRFKEMSKNNDLITFKTYPTLNHLFMPSVYGRIRNFKKEYSIPAHVDEEVLGDIVNFINGL